ncbi:hypothetical protein GUJ93_ZPchr0010g8309 [Zizania palustris]|uniref:Zinc transporter n=1 Tax=Zizania palustris TaxID=103762 RepID=A0A8J6BDD9_ZIZPA|nr:hypothetical protein GUJ93_ZPchr0010g8309 [Zizania palustris]
MDRRVGVVLFCLLIVIVQDVSAVAETEIGNVRTVQEAPDRKLEFLEQYGEVSMLDIKGADASKVILVVGIMTLHSFGEGSGVGVSFAGSKGFSQGLLVTIAIAVHNIPEGLAPIVAVPAFLCADAFQKVLPFCTGFAAGCMIWIVIAEVLPDAFKEAAPSQVASAGTLAVAFMETLGTVLQGFTDGHNMETFAASNVIEDGSITTSFLLIGGSLIYHVATSNILRVVNRKKSSVNVITSSSGLSLSVLTLQSLLACGSVFLHAYAEGLQLGVAARKAYGLGRYMVLPVSLHGLPRGAAVASCMYGATDSWRAALAAAAFTGFAGPSAAISAILAKIDYSGLDYWMVIACGALIPSFGRVFRRSLRLDMRKSILGLLIGFSFASVCLMSTRFICLHTPYCNSAPEAVT